MIVTCITLVLTASISFRAAPKAVHILLSQFEAVKEQKIPSHTTIAQWLKRVGLYKLNLPKEQADDWMLIVDNSTQTGTHKCLVVVGLRQSHLKNKALSFEDVEVVLVEMHENGDKNFIYEMLEKAQRLLGRVLSVCADDGPDIQGGIKLFCEKSGAARVYDTIHKIGTFLRKVLEDDSGWQAFAREASEAKKKMQQTAAAHLAPPNQRTKCRFLNIEGLVRWAVSVRDALRDPMHPDRELLEQFCGWLKGHNDLIDRLQQMDIINLCVRQYVRENGLRHDTPIAVKKLLNERLDAYSLNIEACDYAGMAIDYFTEQCRGMQAGQVLIGSSEIIESLFGKLKNLENDQSKGGFTSLVLGLAACVGKMTPEVVQKAIAQVSTKDVQEWANEQLGETVLSKRRRALRYKRKPLQKAKIAGGADGNAMETTVLTQAEVEQIEKRGLVESKASIDLVVELTNNLGQELAGIYEGAAVGF